MSEEKQEVWCGSTDEEQFEGDYSSKEEAIECYPDEYSVEPGSAFFVGKSSDIDVAALCKGSAGRIVDCLGDRAYDIVGDLCEDWPKYTAAQIAELDADIGKLVVTWMEKYSKPRFFAVVNVTQHIAPEVEDEEATPA